MHRDSIENVDLNSSLPPNAGRISQLQSVRTPRPTPNFFVQPQTFSTKKERHGTPRDNAPPKPPVKSAPPVSRIFPHRLSNKPQPVSFKSSETSLMSPHYNQQSQQLYFDQCFHIEKRLGAGSFGEVFQVRSKEDGKRYAIKRSRDRFRGESDRKRRLEEVAKHEKLPKHPNCVNIIKAWEEKQHLYIQTELCQTSLNYCAEANHNIPEKLIWRYLVDLLMAVKHLHDHDLVHMDIKPENIFVSEDGICKLGDFGLVIDISKPIDHAEAQEGDPKYLAPELLAGRFSSAADVFSLGVTLLELASDLDLPRGGDLWHQLRSGRLPDEFLLGVSEELQSILRWMMEPDPVKRPTVVQLLASPLIRAIHKSRRRQQMMAAMLDGVHALWSWFLFVLLTLWLTIIFPIKSVLPHQLTTPTKPPNNNNNHLQQHHPPEWDHSFSDDEVFGGDDISLHNNSMGVPLDLSSSSNESSSAPISSTGAGGLLMGRPGGLLNTSLKDMDGFVIPRPPARKAMTTPGYRSTRQRTTPVNASPLSARAIIYSSSPRHSPGASGLHTSFRVGSITPNSSFGDKLSEIEDKTPDPPKGNIEPKSLLDAFDSASSEDD